MQKRISYFAGIGVLRYYLARERHICPLTFKKMSHTVPLITTLLIYAHFIIDQKIDSSLPYLGKCIVRFMDYPTREAQECETFCWDFAIF